MGLDFLGHVGRRGWRAAALVRSERAAEAIPEADHIATHVVSYDDHEALCGAMVEADVVLHLAGVLVLSKGATYEGANVATTVAAVRAAEAVAAERVVFVSVLGADPRSGNPYLRSKGEAEEVVAEFPVATILRTPILIGPGTAGGASLWHAASRPSVRLLGGGRYQMRPLDIDDLSAAIIASIESARPGVETLEIVGPEPIAYRALVERTAARMGGSAHVGSIPVALAKLGARLNGLRGGGGITPDVIDVITADEVVGTNADVRLGIELTPLDETIDKLIATGGGAA